MPSPQRIAAFIGAVLVLFALLALTAANNAYADSPTAPVHFFRPKDTALRPGEAATSIIPGKLKYHGGRVMLTSTTHAIYWAPSGHGIPKSYRNLVNRYFKDVGGSKFYGMMKQYYQNPGPQHIQNSSTFGGAWVDKTPYPHAGTGANPLTDADIRGSVARAIAAKGWSTGYGSMFFVFTAKGVESCTDFGCTIGTAFPAYCAYHTSFLLSGKEVIYANMPYAGTWKTGYQYHCGRIAKSPNNNEDADLEISPTSHEHFEGVTDPDVYYPYIAWMDKNGYENGDKCAYYYGTLNADGSNLKMNGHPYIAQLEWSNKANNGKGDCVKK